MRGRTNSEGIVLDANLDTGIIEAGETIVAGDFIEYHDKALGKFELTQDAIKGASIFTLSNGNYIVFCNGIARILQKENGEYTQVGNDVEFLANHNNYQVIDTGNDTFFVWGIIKNSKKPQANGVFFSVADNVVTKQESSKSSTTDTFYSDKFVYAPTIVNSGGYSYVHAIEYGTSASGITIYHIYCELQRNSSGYLGLYNISVHERGSLSGANIIEFFKKNLFSDSGVDFVIKSDTQLSYWQAWNGIVRSVAMPNTKYQLAYWENKDFWFFVFNSDNSISVRRLITSNYDFSGTNSWDEAVPFVTIPNSYSADKTDYAKVYEDDDVAINIMAIQNNGNCILFAYQFNKSDKTFTVIQPMDIATGYSSKAITNALGNIVPTDQNSFSMVSAQDTSQGDTKGVYVIDFKIENGVLKSDTSEGNYIRKITTRQFIQGVAKDDGEGGDTISFYVPSV